MPEKTKKEILEEIENSTYANPKFTQFKEALKELNDEIDELMKPHKDGWTLLTPQLFGALYDKYMLTANRLNAFLNDAENKENEPQDTAIRDVCNTFREYLYQDLDVVRKYKPAMTNDMKSLPTLFEEARVQTVTLYNEEADIQRGGMSARIPMKLTGKEGETIEGFFTEASYSTPIENVQSAMNQVAPYTNTEKGRVLLEHFSELFREFISIKKSPKEENDLLLGFLQAYRDPNVKGRVMIMPRKILEWYHRMIRNIKTERRERLGEITGMDPGEISENIVDILNDIGADALNTLQETLGTEFNKAAMEQEAKIVRNRRVDTRNVAMTRMADLLGMPGIVCESRMMKVRDRDGNVKDGIFMAKARGVDPNYPGHEYASINKKKLWNGNNRVLKQLADLQALDYICGNIDRHGGNIWFEFDDQQNLIGIQGIDNDTSFGALEPSKKANYHMMPPALMKAIPKNTADRILALTPEQIQYTLYGILHKDEVNAAVQRLKDFQDAIRQKKLLLVADNEWRRFKPEDLTVKPENVKGSQMNNIFAEASKTLDEFAQFSQDPRPEVKYKEAGLVNRASDEGIKHHLKKSRDMKQKMNQELEELKNPVLAGVFSDVKAKLESHVRLLEEITNRMASDTVKVEKGTADPGEYFGRHVTRDDLRKIRESEMKIKTALQTVLEDAAEKYMTIGPGPNDDAADLKFEDMDKLDMQPGRIKRLYKTVFEITEYVRNDQKKNPEEEATIDANHRRSVEEIAREIAKNPDSHLLGPKGGVEIKTRPAAKKSTGTKSAGKKTGKSKTTTSKTKGK